MPITTLDPKTALVVIDLQKGIVARAAAPAGAEVVQRASMLADAFRKRGLPVALVNVSAGAPGRTDQGAMTGAFPPDWTELLPELNQQPSDILVTKRTWGAFASTDLEKQIRALGVTQIVLCGISTSAGVESTARQAFEAGFNVTIATDAVTDMSPDAHQNSLARIFPRLSETGTTADIIAKLGGAPA